MLSTNHRVWGRGSSVSASDCGTYPPAIHNNSNINLRACAVGDADVAKGMVVHDVITAKDAHNARRKGQEDARGIVNLARGATSMLPKEQTSPPNWPQVAGRHNALQ